MFKRIISPQDARENFYQQIKDVNENYSEIQIISEDNKNSAVLISKDNWMSIQNTLFLEQTGVLEEVRKREADDSGFTDVETIDWESL